MATQSKAQYLNEVHSLLKRAYKPKADRGESRLTILEAVIYAICREGSPREQANQVLSRFKDEFFDWNEVRVSSLEEIQGVLAGLTDPEVRAQRIRRFLRQLFERTYSFTLEPLTKKPLKESLKVLQQYEAFSSDYITATVIQHALGGHAIPVDAPARRVLERLGIAGPEVDGAAVRSLLELAIPKNRGVEFVDLLEQLAYDTCVEGTPDCPRCELRKVCPTGTSNLSAAAAAAKTASRAAKDGSKSCAGGPQEGPHARGQSDGQEKAWPVLRMRPSVRPDPPTAAAIGGPRSSLPRLALPLPPAGLGIDLVDVLPSKSERLEEDPGGPWVPGPGREETPCGEMIPRPARPRAGGGVTDDRPDDPQPSVDPCGLDLAPGGRDRRLLPGRRRHPSLSARRFGGESCLPLRPARRGTRPALRPPASALGRGSPACRSASEYCAARALEDGRSWSDAIDLLTKARQLEPDSVAILRRLSRLCFALGRTEQAIQYSREVLAADPGDTETLTRLVAFYERKNEPKAAESLLKSVLANAQLGKDSPGRLLADFELGKLYAGKLQRMDQAASAFARVIEALDEKAANRLSPADQQRVLGGDPASAYLEFGVVFLAARKDDLAIKAFRRGLVYEPDHPQLTLLLAQTLQKTGKGEEALALVERYIKLQPQGADSYELLAKILTALHREDEITPRLEAAARADSKNLPLQYALADRYRETGQIEKAEAKYKELLSSQPTPQGYAALVASLVKRKKTDELLRVATEALTKPGAAQVVAGQLNLVAADPAFAEQVLETGLKRLSEDPPGLEPPAFDVLAYIARRSGKLEKLVPIQRLKVERNPSPIAYQELAGTLAGLDKFTEAADVLKDFMAKYPDAKEPRLLIELGKIFRAADRNQDAIEAVREALKREPNNGEAQRDPHRPAESDRTVR